MQLGTLVAYGNIEGEIVALDARTETCIVRYEKPNGKIWISGWISLSSIKELKYGADLPTLPGLC